MRLHRHHKDLANIISKCGQQPCPSLIVHVRALSTPWRHARWKQSICWKTPALETYDETLIIHTLRSNVVKTLLYMCVYIITTLWRSNPRLVYPIPIIRFAIITTHIQLHYVQNSCISLKLRNDYTKKKVVFDTLSTNAYIEGQ